MGKGIIYVMTTAVSGLIKIGKTGSTNYEQRMRYLEQNGYRNVTSLKRYFAIEVEEYDDKEALLHIIFEKSRVADTELFALDINIVTQLLSSLDGDVVFPKTETKAEVFDTAVENSKGKLIPNGLYTLVQKKQSDGKTVKATAMIENGRWTLQKGSVFGIAEGTGVSQKVKAARVALQVDGTGKLLENAELGVCSPSFAGVLVLNQSVNGWTAWKDKNGNPVDIYRKRNEK